MTVLSPILGYFYLPEDILQINSSYLFFLYQSAKFSQKARSIIELLWEELRNLFVYLKLYSDMPVVNYTGQKNYKW